MAKKRWDVWLAAVLLAAAALFVVLGLVRLSRIDPDLTALYLGCAADETNGWSFETEDGPAQPLFGFGGYFEGIASDTAGVVAASRVMEEPGERNMMEFLYGDMGIQVFLDGELLYTDFPNMDNRPDAFLENVDTEGLWQNGLRIALPWDCAGKTLRIVTYGPDWGGYRAAVFPSLTGRYSDAATMCVDIVGDLAAATALVLLALFLLVMFLLGARNGQPQWNLPLLAAYFLLGTVPLLLKCFAASAAGLDDTQPLLVLVSLVYIDFLMAALALEMEGWRRWTLLGAGGVHLLLSVVRVIWNVPPLDNGAQNDPAGLALLALVLSSWKKKAIFRWGAVCIGVVVAVLFAVWGVSRFWGLELLYPLSNPVSSLLHGYPRAFYTILCAVTGALCAVWVVSQFIRTALARQRQEQTLRLRGQVAQESYERALDSIRQTAAMRHEWKNQIAALHLLQQQGDLEGLGQQLEELDVQLDKLAPQQYTAHFTINTILQNAASRASDLGVSFRAGAR